MKECITNIEQLWHMACNGDTLGLKYYYTHGGEVNRRYHAFDKKHSLLMGALRNRMFETAEYLEGVGEMTLWEEDVEYKKIMKSHNNSTNNNKEGVLKMKKLNLNKIKREVVMEYEVSLTEYENKTALDMVIPQNILNQLLILTGKYTENYLTDLLISIDWVKNKLFNQIFSGQQYFGFRKMGVDGNTFITSRCENYKDVKAEYQTNLYCLTWELSSDDFESKVIFKLEKLNEYFDTFLCLEEVSE